MKKIFKYRITYFFPILSLAIAGSSLLLIGFSDRYIYKSKITNMQIIQNELTPLKSAGEWINSKPLGPSDLKRKVVVIQFWTYSCINWIRTLPYVRAWSEKYKEKGLVVIGVHTPEFYFEKNTDNVRRAVKDMKIDFPVAIDNNQEVWNGFGNHYWPALYFIDAHGQIRHTQFGEGDYDQAEKVIQLLLVEAGAHDVAENVVAVNPQGVEAGADWRNLKSLENYLGYERTENFTSPGKLYDKSYTYKPPLQLKLNQWALSGDWTLQKYSVMLNEPQGRIIYRFQARDLHMVMGPALPGTIIRFRVRIDGKSPGKDCGIDVDENGYGSLTGQRLYQLIRFSGIISEHEFEIEFLDQGAEAFSVTFG